ncbi:MAG: energy-coupling factor ABC transporter permease [Ectothiorhodospiraceae bacterium]|nr:energy-coupling factor ABC transporter permease [Ectothiorhodospiraceae bacterium]MCH8502690.1 energy-coupling factor ABC transporter permease [Ectothiorhodospiraceae bacterium]
MHIPDGFLSPQTFLPAAALAVPAWMYAVRRVAAQLDEQTIPRLAVLTALAFVLTTVMIPLPGGTSGHLLGVGLLALAFGIWPAFLAYSLVLLLQALLFGAGGITSLPVNALIMGLLGAALAVGLHGLLRRWHAATAQVVAVWLSVLLSATAMALVLGAQPLLATDDAGRPLFFPFTAAVTVPAIVLPHLLIGLGEGLLTWMILRMAGPRRSGAMP